MYVGKKEFPQSKSESKIQKSCNIYIFLQNDSPSEACGPATLSHSLPSRWLHFIRRLGSFFSFHFCITNSVWLAHDRQDKQPHCSICMSKTTSAADPLLFFVKTSPPLGAGSQQGAAQGLHRIRVCDSFFICKSSCLQ